MWQLTTKQKELLAAALKNDKLALIELEPCSEDRARDFKLELQGAAYKHKAPESLEGLYTLAYHLYSLEDNDENNLVWAATTNQVAIIITLLSKSVDCNATVEGLMPLCMAVHQGHLPAVLALLSHDKIDVNASDGEMDTPLYLAIRGQRKDIADVLLAHPAIKVNMTSSYDNNYTPLHTAAQVGSTEIVSALLKREEIDVNQRSCDAEHRRYITALCEAAKNGSTEIAELLVNHPKINILMKSEEGKTALDYAKEGHHEEIAALLSDYEHVSADQIVLKFSGYNLSKRKTTIGIERTSRREIICH